MKLFASDISSVSRKNLHAFTLRISLICALLASTWSFSLYPSQVRNSDTQPLHRPNQPLCKVYHTQPPNTFLHVPSKSLSKQDSLLIEKKKWRLSMSSSGATNESSQIDNSTPKGKNSVGKRQAVLNIARNIVQNGPISTAAAAVRKPQAIRAILQDAAEGALELSSTEPENKNTTNNEIIIANGKKNPKKSERFERKYIKGIFSG